MNNAGIYNLFVYGSLRSGFRSPAYEYMSKFFDLVGDAKVKGKLYDMGSYSAGVPSNDNTYIVGELYRIRNENEFAWTIGQLDDYEGVSHDFDEVQLYRREACDVKCNGKTYKAWIYFFNGNVDGHPMIESGDLLDYLKRK